LPFANQLKNDEKEGEKLGLSFFAPSRRFWLCPWRPPFTAIARLLAPRTPIQRAGP